ncbi:ABC transporter ATP-binding protein [Endozoicomonas sp. SCSIO W0465]|uniref:ABC transporter ATP-binding protein n=1 Tax=Endozoicomonas sp. SCSIO W0465 TaxID=2918516 RepID=UPI002074F5D7|nr:dipeptide ABC transporter ATP-binding protein [Endozoicomonas sp. SCSIO W0465]USE38652.1 dipeptide ABC transporter ATP-binding protein [Endozoicomonas sp. SCSIO W0465]
MMTTALKDPSTEVACSTTKKVAATVAATKEHSLALSVNQLNVCLRHSPYTPILQDVSFQLRKGEIYALVGESGSGKSMTTLSILRLLPDALEITKGNISLPDTDLFSLTEQEMGDVRGKKIAMIFQDALTALNPVQTVGKQIAETLKLHTTLSATAIRARTVELFAEVGIPEPEKRVDWYPHQMSGGQQQRVMIAMALACEPDILLADEPTTALDVTIQKQILELIKKLTHSHKLAVLLITHDMGVVRQTADRVGVMYQGKIIEQGNCGDFFANPGEAYSQQLIDSLPDRHDYLALKGQQPLLKVEDLAIHFPVRKGLLQRVHSYTRAVDGISFTIGKGETLALVGESGCGKSTTGRAILNLEKTTAGNIWYNNLRLTSMSRREMLPLRKKVQVIFQNPFSSMNPRMTVEDIIEEGMISLGLELSHGERIERIEALLARVKLEPDHRHRYPHEFSGGQRQRIAIARALAVEPDLIICDEPTSALDVSIRAEVLDLLLELQRELNVSYLFITHDLSIIPHIAHRVAVMQGGKIVEQGNTEQVLNQPRHEYTQKLLNAVPAVT